MSDIEVPISGEQIDLVAGDYTATIASVGASLRTLRFRDRDLVVPFSADELRPSFRGATLAPWPNRIVDGRYTFDGAEQQLPLTEPARGNALHGLVAWLDFEVVDRTASSVVLSATIAPQLGYPHRVAVVVSYTLGEAGLETEVEGTHLGAGVAPWGASAHPYLLAGPGPVDDWTLVVPADTVLETAGERLLPAGSHPIDSVRGGELDFRSARSIGDTFVDHAYTDVHRDDSGFATVTVTNRAGDAGVALVWDAACEWVQIHTADRPSPEPSRIGLAVEPMTCAPDAFNSGDGLVRLESGASHAASWRIHAL